MTQISVHLKPGYEIWKVARDIDDKVEALVDEGVLTKYSAEQLFPDHNSAQFRAMFVATCHDCKDADRVVATIQSVEGVDIAHLSARRSFAI